MFMRGYHLVGRSKISLLEREKGMERGWESGGEAVGKESDLKGSGFGRGKGSCKREKLSIS